MKKLLLIFMLGLCALPNVSADENTDKLIDGLLGIGARAIQAQQEKRAEKAAEQAEPVAEGAAEAAADEPAKRTWRDRSKDVVSNLVGGTVNGLGDKPLAEVLSGSVKSAVDILINEYKEQYKQEGRAYAKEVGDLIVTRVLNDPKITHSIYSVQALCWGVIVYLTLVTLVMLASLLHLKRVNSQLLAAVPEMKAALPPAGTPKE